jgi:hypothetical protein
MKRREALASSGGLAVAQAILSAQSVINSQYANAARLDDRPQCVIAKKLRATNVNMARNCVGVGGALLRKCSIVLLRKWGVSTEAVCGEWGTCCSSPYLKQ